MNRPYKFNGGNLYKPARVALAARSKNQPGTKLKTRSARAVKMATAEVQKFQWKLVSPSAKYILTTTRR